MRCCRNGVARDQLFWMALDPYRRVSHLHYRPGIDDPPKPSRVPWIMGFIGLIALLGLVYHLSVSGISSETIRLSWTTQPPP